jgi:hypothetical protein
MRRSNIISAVGIAALVFGCSDEPEPTEGVVAPLELSASAGPVIEMVTGSGHFTPTIGANTGVWRTFSMTARKYADGLVRGNYVRTAHRDGEPAVTNKGVITCYTRIGNKVWIGGYDLTSPEPNDVAWQAVDNGEGASDPPDQMGLQIVASAFGYEAGFAQEFCDDTPDALDFGPPFGVLPLSVILHDIEGGNVQIKVY